MSTVTMREMLEAGVHFGHQTRYWNPQMAPYLFGQRNKIHIINLEKTLPLFNEAINFIGKLAAKKATILFVGTKRTAQKIIQEEAVRCGMPYVNKRWLGGLLTNYKTVKQSINRLKSLEAMQEDGSLERMSKKEALQHMRELNKLQVSLSGIKDMPGIPDAMIVIDVGYENIAVSEAAKLRIPVIGVVDSNNSPKGIDYIVPGNDDAIRSIRLYTKAMADAILDGRGSVSHMMGEAGADEFVELDESGTPVIEDKITKKKVKKTVKKKIIRVASDTGSPDATEGDTEKTSVSVKDEQDVSIESKEQTAKVAATETQPAEDKVKDDNEMDKISGSEADDKKQAADKEDKTAVKKTTKSKTATKKKATKKTAAKKTGKKKTTKKAAAKD